MVVVIKSWWWCTFTVMSFKIVVPIFDSVATDFAVKIHFEENREVNGLVKMRRNFQKPLSVVNLIYKGLVKNKRE